MLFFFFVFFFCFFIGLGWGFFCSFLLLLLLFHFILFFLFVLGSFLWRTVLFWFLLQIVLIDDKTFHELLQFSDFVTILLKEL